MNWSEHVVPALLFFVVLSLVQTARASYYSGGLSVMKGDGPALEALKDEVEWLREKWEDDDGN